MESNVGYSKGWRAGKGTGSKSEHGLGCRVWKLGDIYKSRVKSKPLFTDLGNIFHKVMKSEDTT
jgi:hypothetical protein